MNTNEKLNHIYKLYSEKKYSEAFLLVQEILKTEPQNIYAKRYVDLLKHYLNDKSEVGKIATIKGKNLKCPHCISSISLSALNEEQKTKIRENNYSNLGLKCPYCHTEFVLQKKTANSIIGIKIGEQINYNNKKYRVVGFVKYFGQWYEGNYSGNLNYLEWILLGEDNSYLYFSEGYFLDDGEKKYEFEFSEKIIPDFLIEFYDENLKLNGKNVKISEKNVVTVSIIYGENSKVFTVGEEIILYNFSHNGKNYILEKESAGRQSEAGVYFSESFSIKKACEIFGKEYIKIFHLNDKKTIEFDYESIIVYIFIFSVGLGILFEILGGLFFSIIIFFLILGFIYFFKKEILQSKALHFFIIGPIFASLLFFLFSNIFESKQQIPLQNITEGKKFEIIFEDSQLKNLKETGYAKYDYGGIRTDFEEKTGLSFSIQSEEDKKIIEKIQNKDGISEELEKIFSEKIYKLR